MNEQTVKNIIDPEIEEKLKSYMTEERYRHSLRVYETSIYLTTLYGGDEQKVTIASLFHDVARDLSLSKMKKIIEDVGREEHIPPLIMDNPLLLHPYAGRIITETVFGIKDIEILNAIEIHTTGSINMSLLDKIIFVADYIEPGRNFRGVKRARTLAEHDLDETIFYIVKETLRRLLSKGDYILPFSFELYNHWIIGKRTKRKNGC